MFPDGVAMVRSMVFVARSVKEPLVVESLFAANSLAAWSGSFELLDQYEYWTKQLPVGCSAVPCAIILVVVASFLLVGAADALIVSPSMLAPANQPGAFVLSKVNVAG